MSKILHSRCIMLLIDSAKAWLQLAPILLIDGTKLRPHGAGDTLALASCLEH